MRLFKLTPHYTPAISTFPRRLVFQGGGMDKAPPSPEQFKSPEKQSMEDRLNEVSSQSPSQIFNDTISAGGAVKTRYAQNTTILAGLANDDPLGGGGGSSGTGNGTGTVGVGASTTGQTASQSNTAATNQAAKNRTEQ